MESGHPSSTNGPQEATCCFCGCRVFARVRRRERLPACPICASAVTWLPSAAERLRGDLAPAGAAKRPRAHP